MISIPDLQDSITGGEQYVWTGTNGTYYYFSDYYEKKSNRKISNFLDNFNSKNIDLPIIKSDTKNIIEYKINSDQIINTKQRKFWDLIK